MHLNRVNKVSYSGIGSSHLQAICYQATRRIEISLTEGYSKAGAPRVMKNIMKVLARRFDKSLAPFNMFTVKGCSETVSFRE